jgi:endonuclease/exonuclease/phosphatase (EEP) superfamily protein YafD
MHRRKKEYNMADQVEEYVPDQRSVEETLFKRFRDAFRDQHGFEREEWSWAARNGKRRRFDHVRYRGLRPTLAEYLDHQALSDHRALEVHFAMAA